MSATVTSQIRFLPLFHVVKLKPSGLLPSDLERLAGSVIAGIFAWTRALFSRQLISSCLEWRPIWDLHVKRCRPKDSTRVPQKQVYGWQKGEPRRWLTEILCVIGSSFKPKEGIGTAFNQSEEFTEDTAKI